MFYCKKFYVYALVGVQIKLIMFVSLRCKNDSRIPVGKSSEGKLKLCIQSCARDRNMSTGTCCEDVRKPSRIEFFK